MNKTLGIVIAIIVVGGASFYGGTLYAKSSMPTRNGNGARSGQFGGQFSGVGGAGGRGAGAGMGFAAGEILSKDDKSITLSMRDGSSKIVFYSASTPVMKSVSGSASDLKTGLEVQAFGTANSDGSITAQSLQIRPASSTMPIR